MERIRQAARYMIGTQDFRAIASGHPKERSAVRTVRKWAAAHCGDTVIIECEASGFLKQQIRKANAILLEIGKGKQPVELMRQTLEGREPVPNIPPLPARGLCLIEVKYPEGALEPPTGWAGQD